MADSFGHEWSTERNSPFAADREAAPYCVHCGYRTWTTRATEPCAKHPPAPKPATPEPVHTLTHKHDIYRTASGDFRCRNCDSNGYSLFVERGCPGAQQVARPATPEPRDWQENSKGALVQPAPGGGFFVKPKLPTPEPPEWKGEPTLDPKFWDAGGCKLGSDRLSEAVASARVDRQFEAEYGAFAREEIRRARETCQCGDVVNHSAYHSGHSPVSMYDAMVNSEVDRMMTAPAPSPLDRALSDFIARRKAKREINAAPTEADIWSDFDAFQKADRRALDVSRAFSLTLTFSPRMGMKQP